MDESVKAIKGPDDEHTPEETVDKTIEPDALRIISQNCSMEYIKRLRESPDTSVLLIAWGAGFDLYVKQKA